jgi:hypothetical protein
MQTQKIVNGVRVDRLFDTVHAIEDAPGLARFQFRGQNRWVNGAHNRTSIREFHGAGQEDTKAQRAVRPRYGPGRPRVRALPAPRTRDGQGFQERQP